MPRIAFFRKLDLDLLTMETTTLDVLERLQADPPRPGFPAAARQQLQDALAAVIAALHRCRIAEDPS